MKHSYRKDDTIICCNELNYNFQYQNVAEKSCRIETATTYTVGD